VAEPSTPDEDGRRTVVRFTGSERRKVEDELVSESPVEFRLHGVPVAVLMRTPGNDAELGLGFAITEGIVAGPDELDGVTRIGGSSDGDRYAIDLAEGVIVDPEQFARNFFTSSSCGVCGKASIDAVRIAARSMAPGPNVARSVVAGLPATMRSSQPGFATSGSAHAAAAFTSDGELVALFEDIGRHNAVDKLVGHLARQSWPLSDVMLFVSGRVSFEIVQKAAVAGVPIVGGISGASDLAVDLGNELDMTVFGFVRNDGFNVYCGADRIV